MCYSKIGGWAIWSLSKLLSYSKIPCFCGSEWWWGPEGGFLSPTLWKPGRNDILIRRTSKVATDWVAGTTHVEPGGPGTIRSQAQLPSPVGSDVPACESVEPWIPGAARCCAARAAFAHRRATVDIFILERGDSQTLQSRHHFWILIPGFCTPYKPQTSSVTSVSCFHFHCAFQSRENWKQCM